MTYFLSDGQLAKMRADVEKMLPDTAVIQRVTHSSDGAGGFTESWATVSGGTVACRLDPVYARVQISQAGAAESMRYEYYCTLPYDAPILRGDRITVGGTAYEIRELYEMHSWRVSVRTRVMRVE